MPERILFENNCKFQISLSLNAESLLHRIAIYIIYQYVLNG